MIYRCLSCLCDATTEAGDIYEERNYSAWKAFPREYYDPAQPSASNAHWYMWLQKQLLVNDIAASTPEVPHSYEPDYPLWQREFERYDITSETLLVGHSTGGGFFVRWLSEHPEVQVGKVVLVAPWLDPTGELDSDFFDFVIDSSLANRTGGLVIFNSDDDDADIQDSVQIIRDKVTGAQYREFHNYGHFCLGDMNTVEFPELLQELLA